jgi:quercetin dioxygenase-like cupin family protein
MSWSRSARRHAWLILAIGGLAGTATADVTKPMVVVPAGGAKFVPVDPSQPDSTQIAVLQGDPTKGPSAMLLKFKKATGVLHVHSSDYQLVVLEGTMKHWGERETEATVKPMGPGSFWFQPGGQAHADSCLSDECVMFVTWAGKRDSRLAGAAKPPAPAKPSAAPKPPAPAKP